MKQHMTKEQFNAYMAKQKKPSKYRNVKTEVEGIEFDSKKEASRYLVLKGMERAGIIENLKLQVPFVLYPTHVIEGVTIRGKKYIADFVYTTAMGENVVEDVKGHRTAEYKRKRKMFREKYGFDITEV